MDGMTEISWENKLGLEKGEGLWENDEEVILE